MIILCLRRPKSERQNRNIYKYCRCALKAFRNIFVFYQAAQTEIYHKHRNYKGKSGAYTYAYRLGYAEGRAVIYKRYGKHKGIECRHAETPYGSLFGLENSLQQNEHKNIQNAYHKQENKRMLYFAESTYKRYLLKQYTKILPNVEKNVINAVSGKSCFGFAAILTASEAP